MNEQTKLQDASIITAAFERAMAYEPSEKAVYGSLAKVAVNNKILATSVRTNLTSAIPKLNLSSEPSLSQTTIPINDIKNSASIIAKTVKECIPCQFRLLSKSDIQVASKNLINFYEQDAKNRLSLFKQIEGLFTNLNFYDDFCQLVNFLNSMCLPDLQRMLALLGTMVTSVGSDLVRLNGLVQSLMIPFFMPVFTAMQQLLNQFIQLVLGPINCIMVAISEQLRKVSVDANTDNGKLTLTKNKKIEDVRTVTSDIPNIVASDMNSTTSSLRTGLQYLQYWLTQGDNFVRNKANFYTSQIQQILGSVIQNDLGFVATSSNKLVLIRLISLLRAMVEAKSKGFELCKKPGPQDIDNFVSVYLDPNGPFDIVVEDKQLVIKKKKQKEIIPRVRKSGIDFDKPVSKNINCVLVTSQEDVDKVNRWMTELDSV